MSKLAIIGAGVGGMAAAFDLCRAGHQVEIFEAANYVGGLASGIKEEHWDWSVERFYHHWFQSDSHMLGLIDELGWTDKVLFPRPKTVAYHNGKFYPLDSPLAALTFPGYTFFEMVRFGLVTVYLRYLASWQTLEKYTAVEWMRRWYGEDLYRSMLEPLLSGKFGNNMADVNMAWMWARLKTRTTRLGTFEGGFQAFCDRFAEDLRQRGVKIHLSMPVSRIDALAQGGVSLDLSSGGQVFDRCLVTSSPALLARLAPDMPSNYLQGLLQLKSMGAVVMILALRHQLSEEGYYWFNIPKSAGYPFLALVEHTNYLSPDHFGGEHIIYCGDYLDPDHEYFRLSDDELLERFLPALKRFNPKFERDWVRKIWVSKTAYAQPIPLVNHSFNIPDIRTPLSGLYFASMSQVYPWDRGTNFAVEIGRRAAQLMLTDLE
ncbi:MAG: NAD(P)/FAD-dependent oxidoreductase [Anaerolineaceae bacterium]|nr:NAD(P)/FAD-dependent oxidoreductase [Anaerolineaceae bacterium]